jgi:IS4 transposase
VSHESGIISDQLVQLGKSTYLTGLFRLVTIERKHQSNLRILTNRMDLSAEAIGKMYQSRWQIELFFKHIKQHLTIKTYYSQSEQGVENQVILAMIVYLLTLLMKLELRLKSSLFTILRQIRALQYEPFECFKESFAPS